MLRKLCTIVKNVTKFTLFKRSLLEHERVKHEEFKRLECMLCLATFSKNSSLVVHLKTIHTKRDASENNNNDQFTKIL